MENEYPKICYNCINFIMIDKTSCGCDYEYWYDSILSQALLNVPEMYDCLHFEYNIDIKEILEKKEI